MAAQIVSLATTFQRHVADIERSLSTCDSESLWSIECRAESLLTNVCRAQNILGREGEALFLRCQQLVRAIQERTRAESTEHQSTTGFRLERGGDFGLVAKF